MKFTDGYWMMQPGVTAAYPAEVLDVEAGPDSLVVYAPGHPVRDRGDLLKGPSLTVEIGAPAADVIRVSVTHFAGADRGPDFGLLDQEPVSPRITDEADAASVTSGELTARVAKGEPWRLDFLAGGRRLTGSGTKALAIVDTADGQSFVREQLDLGVGQFVYGLGERFGPLVKNGQSVDIYRVPWQFDEESVEVLRRFTKLKATLMPYLFEVGMQAVREGAPVMRAMAVEFPGDPACAHLEQQYMLGGDLLVAPVFTAEGDVSYYVPEGVWTHLETGRRVKGPRWVTEQHGFLSVPLLARPGSVIPLGSTDDRPDYDYTADVTLRISELDDGARVVTSVPALDGVVAARFTTAREGGTIRITASSPDAGREFGWSVRVSGVHVPVAVDGGVPVAEDDAGLGVRIKATDTTMAITV